MVFLPDGTMGPSTSTTTLSKYCTYSKLGIEKPKKLWRLLQPMLGYWHRSDADTGYAVDLHSQQDARRGLHYLFSHNHQITGSWQEEATIKQEKNYITCQSKCRNEVEKQRLYLFNIFSVQYTPSGFICYVHILIEINIDDWWWWLTFPFKEIDEKTYQIFMFQAILCEFLTLIIKMNTHLNTYKTKIYSENSA